MLVDKTGTPVFYTMNKDPIEQVWGISANIQKRFGKFKFCTHDIELEILRDCS